MKVREQNDGVHDLGEGPVVVAARQALDVLGVEEPRPMGENLVDVVDGTQFGRYVIEALQPVGIAALVDELLRVQIDEVDALVASRGLEMAFSLMFYMVDKSFM